MDHENTTAATLFISLVIHSVVIISIPFYKNIPQKKELTNLEITYQGYYAKKSAENRGGVSKDMPKVEINKEMLLIKQKELPKTLTPQEKPQIEQPYKFKLYEFSKPQETIAVSKPKLPAPNPKRQKISLKELPVETSKDQIYLGYRDIIRKKIQDKVYYYSEQYFYFDYPREGKIFVSFTLSPEGELTNLDIIENKSSQDNILKKIVLTSIEKSSPFQKFPKGLKQENHSFNLEISFETQ